MIDHSCPRCGSDDLTLVECGKNDCSIFYLQCNQCKYTSLEYTKAELIDHIWPSTVSLDWIFECIKDTLDKAVKKHPEFAEGQYEALGYLGEEYGEVAKEITKGKEGWEGRMTSELYDLIAVAIRMLRREYKK